MRAVRKEITMENQSEHEKWLRYEEKYRKQWLKQQRKIENIEKAKHAERKKINEEFLAQQKCVEKLKRDKEEQEWQHNRQRELLEHSINNYITGVAIDLPIELYQIAESNPGKSICGFFKSTATCRFGNKCVKNHSRPKISKILLISKFFTHICLDQCKKTEYGGDFQLEFEESEIYQKFVEFYDDVIPEFEKFGLLKYVAVCNNSEAHLRGNVYIEFVTQR